MLSQMPLAISQYLISRAFSHFCFLFSDIISISFDSDCVDIIHILISLGFVCRYVKRDDIYRCSL